MTQLAPRTQVPTGGVTGEATPYYLFQPAVPCRTHNHVLERLGLPPHELDWATP